MKNIQRVKIEEFKIVNNIQTIKYKKIDRKRIEFKLQLKQNNSYIGSGIGTRGTDGIRINVGAGTEIQRSLNR